MCVCVLCFLCWLLCCLLFDLRKLDSCTVPSRTWRSWVPRTWTAVTTAADHTCRSRRKCTNRDSNTPQTGCNLNNTTKQNQTRTTNISNNNHTTTEQQHQHTQTCIPTTHVHTYSDTQPAFGRLFVLVCLVSFCGLACACLCLLFVVCCFCCVCELRRHAELTLK